MTTSQPVLASTVLSAVLRVAGPVPTHVHPHALGTPEQQVSLRIGDALVYLTEPVVSSRIRQQWDATQYLAARRLPKRASPTWLAPQPGTYPLGVALRLTGAVEVATQWIMAHHATSTPAHLRIRVDRLIWQICDQESWQCIGHAWYDAAHHLDPDHRAR